MADGGIRLYRWRRRWSRSWQRRSVHGAALPCRQRHGGPHDGRTPASGCPSPRSPGPCRPCFAPAATDPDRGPSARLARFQQLGESRGCTDRTALLRRDLRPGPRIVAFKHMNGARHGYLASTARLNLRSWVASTHWLPTGPEPQTDRPPEHTWQSSTRRLGGNLQGRTSTSQGDGPWRVGDYLLVDPLDLGHHHAGSITRGAVATGLPHGGATLGISQQLGDGSPKRTDVALGAPRCRSYRPARRPRAHLRRTRSPVDRVPSPPRRLCQRAQAKPRAPRP